MQGAYDAIAEAADASPGDARSAVSAMFESSFERLSVEGSSVTYVPLVGGDSVICTYTAEGVGTTQVEADGETVEVPWSQFAAVGACPGYHYLVLAAEPHADGEDGLLHFHLRYGEGGFEPLLNDPALAMWWPTPFEMGTTAQDLAAEMTADAEGFAAFLNLRP